MLASPTALKDYLFTDPEAEYQSRHYGETDISRRELSASAGTQYLRRSGDGSLNVRTNHHERFHTKTGPVEHPPAFPRPVIGADRQRWHLKRRPVGRIGEHASPVPIVPVHETTPPGCRRISDRSRPNTCGPPTRKQNINPCMMHRLIFPVVSLPLRPVRVIRRPFPVVPCPIADCRLSAFARRPAAWNVLHPTRRGREGVLWRMGKAGTVWRRASRCAVS